MDLDCKLGMLRLVVGQSFRLVVVVDMLLDGQMDLEHIELVLVEPSAAYWDQIMDYITVLVAKAYFLQVVESLVAADLDQILQVDHHRKHQGYTEAQQEEQLVPLDLSCLLAQDKYSGPSAYLRMEYIGYFFPWQAPSSCKLPHHPLVSYSRYFQPRRHL